MQAPEHPDVMDTFRSLLRTARKLRRLVRPLLTAYDLTGAQYGTLSRIPLEGISLTELAESSSSDLATVSGVVERLAKSGLATRERSPADRRVVVIRLTERGKAVVEAIAPQYREVVARVLGKMAPERLAALCDLLDEVERLVGRVQGDGERHDLPPVG